jgi:hypothetical protein
MHPSGSGRFDVYPNLRYDKRLTELRIESNLGPGSYSLTSLHRLTYNYFSFFTLFYFFNFIIFLLIFKFQRPRTTQISKSVIPQQYSIIKKESAPPIGTYDVKNLF